MSTTEPPLDIRTDTDGPGRRSDGTEILALAECWDLLRTTTVGRLAIAIAGKPDIFPINHVVDGDSLVFRSAPGTKLAAAALLHDVAFEIDGYEAGARTAWSVVVKGRANLVERMEDRYAADDLPLFPWVASPKPDVVRITPTLVTGRRFRVVDEVAPDASIGCEPVGGSSDDAAVPRPGVEYHPGGSRMRPG